MNHVFSERVVHDLCSKLEHCVSVEVETFTQCFTEWLLCYIKHLFKPSDNPKTYQSSMKILETANHVSTASCKWTFRHLVWRFHLAFTICLLILTLQTDLDRLNIFSLKQYKQYIKRYFFVPFYGSNWKSLLHHHPTNCRSTIFRWKAWK